MAIPDEAIRNLEAQFSEALAGLHQAGRSVTSLPFNEALSCAVAAGRKLLGSEATAILLREPGDGEGGFTCASIDSPAGEMIDLCAPCLREMASQVFSASAPLRIDDASPELVSGLFPRSGLQVRSLLVNPLLHQGQPLGILVAVHSQAGAFNDHHTAILSVLADFTSLAVANQRLVEREGRQRRQLETTQAQLVQSEKLNAMGRLVAFLAHEINNPLQSLRSGLELMVEFPLPEEKRRAVLTTAQRELDRLSGIVERVLGFSRRSGDLMSQVDLHQLLDETIRLLEQRLGRSGIQVQRCYDPDLPRIDGHYDQLHQVFLNLILNAVAAMPEGGTLTLSTAWSPKERQVHASVQDTGAGMDADILPHIFEPFFTTRADGSGLGLAISASIIEKHRGSFSVSSKPGEGSIFTVVLPTLTQ